MNEGFDVLYFVKSEGGNTEIEEGFNPITEETVIVQRRVVEVLNDLTFGDDYRNFLQDQILTQDEAL